MMNRLLALLFLFLPTLASAQLPAGCENDASLTGRTDVILCERWESSTWWQNNWNVDGRKTNPQPAVSGGDTSIQTSGCISGNCLRVNCNAWNVGGGCGGSTQQHKPIPGSLTEVYIRYYLYLAPNWSPSNFCGSAQPSLCGGVAGESVTSGGKWPGPADTRTGADPSGQCGNGGDYSDGINCWSGRFKYRDCLGSGNVDICTADIHGQTATTRIGWYWYVPPSTGTTNQVMGAADNQAWGTANSPCASSSSNLGSSGSDSTSCGKGAAGLINGHWYMVEQYVKMNTPGVADGVSRIWINGSLKYEKTNMLYRNVGHDNLHVRTFWLNFHAGGEGVGPAQTTYQVIDELVIIDASGWGGNMALRPGAWKKVAAAYTTPSTVTVGAAPPAGGTCSTTGTGTMLERAANGLAPGGYCELGTSGLTWAFIQSQDVTQENHLEYSSKGIYDSTRRKVRYMGGPHTGTMKCLEYDEVENSWSGCTNPPNSSGGHGYDHNAVDPATGDHYWRTYGATSASRRYYRWNGSSWAEIANNTCESGAEITAGMDWDNARNGFFASNDNGGVAFYSKALGTWACYGNPFTGPYHFWAGVNQDNGLVWFHNNNGSSQHWRLNLNNSITELSTPPLSLGCCGSNGRLTAYDYRSKKFVVANAYNNQFYEYDIATDQWTAKGVRVPLDLGYDQSNVEGFVTPIPSYGGVLLYVVARNTGGTPKAFLYKHN